MNHYQKVATVIVRVLGTLCGLCGIINLLIVVIFSLEISIRNSTSPALPIAAQERVFLYNGLYFTIVGIILFLVSKFIGKFAGKGLEQ